jgi:hypothetical protein
MPDPSPSNQREPEWEPQAPPGDPRTAQFFEVVLVCVLLLAAHGIVLALHIYADMISIGAYMMITGICFPLIILILAFGFWCEGRWHWGQVVLAMMVTLLLSFFQLMLMGCESASC